MFMYFRYGKASDNQAEAVTLAEGLSCARPRITNW